MPSHFHLEYVDPPEKLRLHVLALFHFVWSEPDIEDLHPGAMPQLVLMPRGEGAIRFGQQVDPISESGNVFSGFSVAAPFSVRGPWHAIGASLTPLGWAALTGVPANTHLDRFLPAADVLAEHDFAGFADETNTLYRSGKISGRDGCYRLAKWIELRLAPVPAKHRKLIGQVVAWVGSSLNPEIDDLFDRLPYSRRQAERLVERYFGFPPAALARKYRAIRAAALLGEPRLSDADEAELAEAFYDQPHMVREIRRYCGFTPTLLGGASKPLFQTLLQLKNLERFARMDVLGEER